MQLFEVSSLSDAGFNQILSFLRRGGVIGFPTDTAYGLGADASNEMAVRKIFEIKGRPETKPILLVVDSIAMVEGIAAFSDAARALAATFWPGPLTLVLPAERNISPVLTAGTGGIGVRWPDAPFATRLANALGRPVTATSANRSGMPAAVTAAEVRAQLEGQLEVVVDGGTLPVRGGSTLLDLTQDPPVLLREGPVSYDAIKRILPNCNRPGE
jgi:L-threonylcarbamoyladenylate synthase